MTAMAGGICGLTAVAPRAVPPVAATTAFILVLAALGVALIR
ncbi:hypothetical protein PV755_00655 [Streptomyces caniscabiei]|nr:hypothetical protein [Streptomyces caniscabiei]MDX3507444.1 hypothetical protein [Streptomyces caniscabiei]